MIGWDGMGFSRKAKVKDVFPGLREKGREKFVGDTSGEMRRGEMEEERE